MTKIFFLDAEETFIVCYYKAKAYSFFFIAVIFVCPVHSEKLHPTDVDAYCLQVL